MTGFFRSFCGAAENSADLRIFEDRCVKVHNVLCLIIKPQEWSNFLHQNLCRFDADYQPAEFGVSRKSHTMPRCQSILVDTWILSHVERSRYISGLNFPKENQRFLVRARNDKHANRRARTSRL